MANLSNINNILRTGSLGVGINRDPLGAFEISSATKPGIKMFNTAASGKTYEAYSDVNGNYIIYDQDADDNRFIINTSGNATFAGDVGIGVTPTKALQVNGEALFGNGTDGLLLSYSSGNSSGIIDTGFSATALEFRVGNTQELLINGSSATFAGEVTISAETQYLNFKKASTADILSTIVSETDAGTGGKLRFLTKRNGDTQVNALILDDNQNVGIAWSSPSDFTSVNADNLVVGPGTGSNGITVFSATNAYGQLAFADGTGTNDQYKGLIQYAHPDDSMRLFTANTERMRITSGARINMNVMPTHTSEGVIRFGRYDGNTSRYNEIQNSVTSTGTGSYMNLSVHSGTENVITDVMTLLGSGNVGIGTASPTNYKLEVDGNVKGDSFGNDENTTARIFAPEGAAYNGSGTQTGYLIIKLPDNGAGGINNMMSGLIRVFDYAGNESFDVHFAGYWYSGYNWTNCTAWIESQSNVDRNFNVRFGAMTGAAGSNTRPYITIGEGNSTWSYCKFSVMEYTSGHSNMNLYKWNSGWEMALSSTAPGVTARVNYNCQGNNWTRNAQDLYYGSGTGAVGIGDTSPAALANRLTIAASGGTGNVVDISTGSTANNNVGAIVFRNSARAYCGQITVNGATGVTSYLSASDYRLKEDLQDFQGLNLVSNIKVYNYKWKSADERTYGVMAHELQEVLPQAVVGEKDHEEMQSVDYSKIVPLLVKSIQELKAEIELLKSK
jgi:hypothetical protein